MRNEINSNHSNQAFNREIDNCKGWFQTRIFDACGYSSGVLLDRLMQYIAEKGHYPYALAVSSLCKTGNNCFPPHGAKINCARASVEAGSGRVTLTSKQWLSSQMEFFMYWTFCLIAILAIKKNASKNNQPAVLALGIGDENLFNDGSDERFANYCRLGPIEPLRNGKRLLIQSSSKDVTSCNPDCFYSKNPLLDLLRQSNLGLFGRLRLIANHLILFFEYTLAVFRLPQYSLLGKDFALSRISRELDNRGLIDSIVLTCSAYTNQPLWLRELRRSKVHMIWYAQNWRPLAYAADKVVTVLPQLRWIRVDTHWVWTHAFAKYLKGLGYKAIEVVGPIVWYLPEIAVPTRDAIEITIFDTPAFSDEVAVRCAGEITNYYHPDNLLAYIQDIVSLKSAIEQAFHLPVLMRLKTKRDYHPIYDRGYFDHLEKLNSIGTIALVPPSTNIYSLVSGSHLVISYPFSTTAYISEALKVSTIFYDPTKSVLRQDFCDSPSLVNFADCPHSLLKAALSELSNSFPAPRRDAGQT